MAISNNFSILLSETHQLTYNRLQQALGLKLRRQVFIAVCDNLNLRNYLASQLEADLLFKNQSDIVPESLISPALISLKLDLSNPNLFQGITQWYAENKSDFSNQDMVGFQILGVEHLTRQPPAKQWSFLRYLRTLENHLDGLEFSLVLWISSPWLYCIEQSAPEFWERRTGVFEWISDPTPSDVESERISLAESQVYQPIKSDQISDPVQEILNKIQKFEQQSDLYPLYQSYRQLGNVYRDRIIAGEHLEVNYTLAIQAYQQVLEIISELDKNSSYSDDQDDDIHVFNDLGTLYWMGFRQRLKDNLKSDDFLDYLENSIIFYQNALMKTEPESHANLYIQVQKNLGTAYADLASFQDNIKNLEQSIIAYTEALCYLNFNQPEINISQIQDYATIQNNLGTTYWKLAQKTQPIPNLKAAIDCYTEAMEFYTPQQDPLNYALLQTNLGTAYWTLSQHQPSAKLLLQAIYAYHQALTYRTTSTEAIACAATYNNLGIVYWHLANHYHKPEIRAKFLKRAIAAYKKALSIVADLNPSQLNFDPLATHNNLGLTHYQLATDSHLKLEKNTRIACLKNALKHHIKAIIGESKQQLTEDVISNPNNSQHHQITLGYLLRTIRAFYHESGLPGQNQALSQIPAHLLSEILPKILV